LAELKNGCGFEYYRSKHLENTLTKFLQLYWLPNKFKVDKRKSHFSSMIVSEQMSREQALSLLEQPPEGSETLSEDITYLIRQLNIQQKEWEDIVSGEAHQYHDYPTSMYIRITKLIRKARWRFLSGE
jgi:hypothetical protein